MFSQQEAVVHCSALPPTVHSAVSVQSHTPSRVVGWAAVPAPKGGGGAALLNATVSPVKYKQTQNHLKW